MKIELLYENNTIIDDGSTLEKIEKIVADNRKIENGTVIAEFDNEQEALEALSKLKCTYELDIMYIDNEEYALHYENGDIVKAEPYYIDMRYVLMYDDIGLIKDEYGDRVAEYINVTDKGDENGIITTPSGRKIKRISDEGAVYVDNQKNPYIKEIKGNKRFAMYVGDFIVRLDDTETVCYITKYKPLDTPRVVATFEDIDEAKTFMRETFGFSKWRESIITGKEEALEASQAWLQEEILIDGKWVSQKTFCDAPKHYF